MLRCKLFDIFGRFQTLKYVARYIVYYMDKFDLSISDHNRGEFHSFVYLMRETEWDKPSRKYLNKEVDSRENFFLFEVPVKYEWKGVPLGTEDMPWFCRQNRYRINKACSGAWYYENFVYYFQNLEDRQVFRKIATRYGYLADKY